MNPSPTELTTAATDAALGLLCLVLLARLRQTREGAAWKVTTWAWVFKLIVLASILGTIVHGLVLPEFLRALLWLPLYLSLALAVSLFLVGAVADWRGEAASRALLPWALAFAGGFFVASKLLDGAFVVFVGYEAVLMVAAFVMYCHLAMNRRLPGAGLVSAGIALSLVAAGLQVTRASIRVIVPFDHNGLFHIVQMIAVTVTASGLRRGLRTHGANPITTAEAS